MSGKRNDADNPRCVLASLYIFPLRLLRKFLASSVGKDASRSSYRFEFNSLRGKQKRTLRNFFNVEIYKSLLNPPYPPEFLKIEIQRKEWWKAGGRGGSQKPNFQSFFLFLWECWDFPDTPDTFYFSPSLPFINHSYYKFLLKLVKRYYIEYIDYIVPAISIEILSPFSRYFP